MTSSESPPSTTPYRREWQFGPGVYPSALPKDRQFTVMTYNILNDSCIWDGVYDFCDPSIKYMPHRHKLIKEEIRQFNPCIVCMQEVNIDQYDTIISPMMVDLGFGCVFSGRDLHVAKHGDAIFYRKDTFILVQSKTHTLYDIVLEEINNIYKNAHLDDMTKAAVLKQLLLSNQVVLARLRHTASQRDVHVANVHVHWGEMRVPDVQAIQTCAAIRCLQHFLQGRDNPCYILAGDFNTPPGWPSYQVIEDTGRPNVKNTELLRELKVRRDDGKTICLLDAVPDLLDISLKLKSSYKCVLGEEVATSSCDYDYSTNKSRTWSIDYIWFGPNTLEAAAVLQTPPDDVITREKALPSSLFPSDHLPLVAQFVIKY